MVKRKRRAFDAEFKAEAVRLCKVGDRSIGQVAKDLDLTETALRDWVRRADIDAGKGPPGALTTAEREELARLRRGNKGVERGGGLLKAAAPLFPGGSEGSLLSSRGRRGAFPSCPWTAPWASRC